ncbi:unnamed protein product, partial [Closterium sp. NIES-53]
SSSPAPPPVPTCTSPSPHLHLPQLCLYCCKLLGCSGLLLGRGGRGGRMEERGHGKPY